MAKKTTTLQDMSLGKFNIASGSSREGYFVTFDSASSKRVKLAKADDISTCPAVAAIVTDNGTDVRIRREGQIRAKLESGLGGSIGPGERVFLSTTDEGKLTNVIPTSDIIQEIGITEGNWLSGDYIRVSFTNNSQIILLN